MVPHFWIVESLGMVGLGENFLSESMKRWRVDLTCNNESLGEVNVKWEIFQSDSLSTLLFVFCLIPLTVILHKPESAYKFSRVVCQEWKGFGVTCSDSRYFQWWYWHEIWDKQMCYISSEEGQNYKFWWNFIVCLRVARCQRSSKIDKFRIRELCKRVQKNFAYCCKICGYRFDWANPRNYNWAKK